jgi:hypothetical protein
LELLAADFLMQSPYRLKNFFWFDWIIRDVFAYLYYRANSYVVLPGVCKVLSLGDEWRSKVATAYHRAVKACDYEMKSLILSAGEEWQKIFGQQIPRCL